MKRPSCPRAWEAGAIEDARLDGLGRASFERHAAVCDECSRERADLSRLRAIIDALPRMASTPLERRRLRMALLAKANRETVVVASSSRRWLAIFSVAVLVVSVASAVVLKESSRRAAASVEVRAPAPTSEVRPIGSAEWNVEHTGEQAEIRLTRGVVAIHVDKLGVGQRFLVILPDGELEVRGTRFVAEVREGRTTRIEVTEGSVSVRLGSKGNRTLDAGDSWRDDLATDRTQPAEDVPSNDTMPADSAAIMPSRGGAAPVSPRPRAKERREVNVPLVAGGASRDTTDSALPRLAGVAFADAMASFDKRAYDRADELFAYFEQRFSVDSRAEDAEFMRILIRLRVGDAHGGRQRAHAYLGHHPRGLRHAEVEAFLRRLPADTGGP